MCGIAGYIGNKIISNVRAEACLQRMRHRGPDGEGLFRHSHLSGSHALLLHSRLSIIDLNERSAQPMRLGTKVIAFNGEIYNHVEIRNKLESRGESFSTSSDTEVLLRTLCQNKQNTLDELKGMWAFALYDEQTGCLTLSRDRFGEKPLYIHHTEDGLYFGSEIKFITALTGQQFTPDQDQIRRYLVDGYRVLYKHNPCFHSEISELPAASSLTKKPNGEERTSRYWTPCLDQEPDMTFDEAVSGVRERLIRSMEIRLRSDVPLAFCMSGGVDSNVLISIAKNIFDYDVKGFTVVNQDARYAEMHLVRQAVESQGLKHTPIPLETTDFLPRLRSLVQAHDAPVYTISYYVHWLMMNKIAENGYKVAISGTGADELFTGYYDHYAMYLDSVHGLEKLYNEAEDNWRRFVKPVVRNPFLQNPTRFIENPNSRTHLAPDKARFSAIVKNSITEDFFEKTYVNELLRNRMLNEMFVEVVPVILHEDDHNAMFHSIENRSPYLDHELFEFCQRIPSRHLMRNGYNKAVLREAFRGIAPDSILDERRKVGFNAPIMDLLDVKDPMVLSTLLEDSPIFDLVDRKAIENLLSQKTLNNSESKFLFSFLGSKFFIENFG